MVATASQSSAWQLELTPRVHISEEYNDNVYLTNDDEEEDFITASGLGFTLKALGKHSTLTLDYDPQYQYFAQINELSFWEHKAGLAFESQLTRQTKFKIEDRFAYTEDPFFVTDIVITEFKGIKKADYTVRKDRRPYTTNTGSAALTHETRSKNTVELNYLYSILKNDDEVLEDNERHQPSLEFNYKLTPHNTLDLLLSYTRGNFEISEDMDHYEGSFKWTRNFSPTLDGYFDYNHVYTTFDRDKTGYQVYTPMVGITSELGKQTELTLGAGFFHQDKGAAGTDSGFSGDFDLKHSFEHGAVSLTASYGSDETYFGTENLGLSISYDAGLRFSYQLMERLFFNIGGTYRRDEYKDLEEPRIDDIYQADCGLTYIPSFFKWTLFSLNYIFRDLDSTDHDKLYGNSRVVFRITLAPERPYTKNL